MVNRLQKTAYKLDRRVYEVQEHCFRNMISIGKFKRQERKEIPNPLTESSSEEEIREYKETLTCPSCKVKRKDAILTKCFHVFCYDCLR